MKLRMGKARLVFEDSNFYRFKNGLEIIGGSDVRVNGNNFFDGGMAVTIDGAQSFEAKNNVTSTEPNSEKNSFFHSKQIDFILSLASKKRVTAANSRKSAIKQSGFLSQTSLNFCIKKLHES